MKRFLAPVAVVCAIAAPLPARAGDSPSTTRDAAVAAVERHRDELIGLADRVWSHAETALRERESARDLADFAERQGFRVGRGVAGLPTAFLASFGQGRPIIGLLGEYGALPGLSQRPLPTREPLAAGRAGHGCGHNLLGAAAPPREDQRMFAGLLSGQRDSRASDGGPRGSRPRPGRCRIERPSRLARPLSRSIAGGQRTSFRRKRP
jgi:hypothetical protein